MTVREADRPLPWRITHLMLVYVLNGLGAIALASAWYGASGTAKSGAQIRWVILGSAALIVMGTANTLWLLVGRSAVTARKRLILRPVELLRSQGESAERPVVEVVDDRVFSAPGMERYHRPACQLAVGKDAQALSVSEATRAGLKPCGVCEP